MTQVHMASESHIPSLQSICLSFQLHITFLTPLMYDPHEQGLYLSLVTFACLEPSTVPGIRQVLDDHLLNEWKQELYSEDEARILGNITLDAADCWRLGFVWGTAGNFWLGPDAQFKVESGDDSWCCRALMSSLFLRRRVPQHTCLPSLLGTA